MPFLLLRNYGCKKLLVVVVILSLSSSYVSSMSCCQYQGQPDVSVFIHRSRACKCVIQGQLFELCFAISFVCGFEHINFFIEGIPQLCLSKLMNTFGEVRVYKATATRNFNVTVGADFLPHRCDCCPKSLVDSCHYQILPVGSDNFHPFQSVFIIIKFDLFREAFRTSQFE